MKYQEILKTIAGKEQCSPKQIEKEMKKALQIAGISCSPKVFLQRITQNIQSPKTYK